MRKNRENTAASVSGFAAKSGYEGSVGARAVARAGKCKNLKGHVFEIMHCDRFNANPIHSLQGKTAHLTKSPVATRDDVIIMQGKKVIQRLQLKDTPSVSGARDTFRRMAGGQYKGTSGVVTTKETAKEVAKLSEKSGKAGEKVLGKLHSSGISTMETELVAAKMLGGNPIHHVSAIAHHAPKSGAIGGAVTAGIACVQSMKKVRQGEWDVKKAVAHTAKEGAYGAAAGTAADAVGSAVTIAVAATPAAPLAMPAGIAADAAAGYAVEKGGRAIEKGIRTMAVNTKRAFC